MDEPPFAPAKLPARRLIASSGLLLFVCMFLPAVKACSDPVYPVQTVVFTPPYLVGLFLAILALCRPVRWFGWLLTLRIVTLLTSGALAIWAVMEVATEPVAAILLLPAGILAVATFGGSQQAERATPRLATAYSAVSVIWFSGWILVAGDDVLFGLWVSVLAATGLTLGCNAWWRAAGPAPPGSDLPRAITR